jgi:hypothetical protein
VLINKTALRVLFSRIQQLPPSKKDSLKNELGQARLFTKMIKHVSMKKVKMMQAQSRKLQHDSETKPNHSTHTQTLCSSST